MDNKTSKSENEKRTYTQHTGVKGDILKCLILFNHVVQKTPNKHQEKQQILKLITFRQSTNELID